MQTLVWFCVIQFVMLISDPILLLWIYMAGLIGMVIWSEN